MTDKLWVLTLGGKPCFFKKRWRVAKTWDVNRAAWFRDEAEFRAWRLSRFVENDFMELFQYSKLKLVRKTWWRLLLWRKFNRYRSDKDSWFRRLDLTLCYHLERLLG